MLWIPELQHSYSSDGGISGSASSTFGSSMGGNLGFQSTLPTTTSTSESAGVGVLRRTPTGAYRGVGAFSRSTVTQTGKAQAGGGTKSSDSTDQLDYVGQGGGFNIGPLPLQSTRQNISYTSTETSDVMTAETRTTLFEAVGEIAKKGQHRMLFFVADRKSASRQQLTGPLNETDSGLKIRILESDEKGNVEQLATINDRNSNLLNLTFGNVNWDQLLLSTKFVGKQKFEQGSAARGFDGAAIGFTIPTTDGNNACGLAFTQMIRNFSTMEPVAMEEAVGTALSYLLRGDRQRGVFAAIYRGAQDVITQGAETLTDKTDDNPAKITDVRAAQHNVELLWRVVPVSDSSSRRYRESAWEINAVLGGKALGAVGPTALAVKGRYETPTESEGVFTYAGGRAALGVTIGYNEVDLLREFLSLNTQATNIFRRTTNYFGSIYGWSENDSKTAGMMIAGSYLYSQLESWAGSTDARGNVTPAPSTPNPHYASLLFRYWASKNHFLIGGERAPWSGANGIYSLIDGALAQIQTDPTQEQVVLQTLAKNLQSYLGQDIWRFAFGWGYDGEKVKLYAVGGAEFLPDQTGNSGNLYALALFDRGAGTKFYADILGHVFNYVPLVISQTTNPATGAPKTDILYGKSTPYVSVYGGLGYYDWIGKGVYRYENRSSVPVVVDPASALRDCYREVGQKGSSDPTINYAVSRLRNAYGSEFVKAVEDARGSLDWMIRPLSEVQSELSARAGKDVDFYDRVERFG
ncbi:hypothetical protein HZC07_00835, partial [Candidatus Micrarchaeota archaeon]|nr:hypothetical protein [Candidatus Micrarchaeota archaeon]